MIFLNRLSHHVTHMAPQLSKLHKFVSSKRRVCDKKTAVWPKQIAFYSPLCKTKLLLFWALNSGQDSGEGEVLGPGGAAS